MKQILFAMILLPLLAKADTVYDKFLALKEKGKAEWHGFYHSISNNMSGSRGIWRENGSGLVFTVTNICHTITNVECYVDLVKVSTNVVSTNLLSVTKRFSNGEALHFTYLAAGKISQMEHWLSISGDFKCYDLGTNDDLECYCSVTNFIGEHGVMTYKNGKLVKVGNIPDFSVLREDP